MRKNEQKQNRKRLNSQNTSQKLPPLNKRAPEHQSHNLGNISHQDQGLVGLLYEYFIKNSFMDTLQCFQRDCGKGFKPNSKSIQAFKQQMIQAFQQGSRDIFFTRFGQFVPISMRTKDLQTMKLQFYIQVYFFVYTIHPQLGKKRQIDANSKQAFTLYLQGRGSSLARSNQFLQYYALAYLQKPQEHPTFKTIFTKEWINQLKKRVVYFIQKLYPVGKVPVIVNIYDKFIQRSMERSSQLSITQADDQQQIQQQIEVIQESNSGLKQLSNSKTNQIQQSLRSPTLQERDKNDRQKEQMAMKISELEEQNNQIKKFIENVKIKYQSLQNNYENFTQVAQSTLIDSQTKWFKITQQFYGIANNLLEVCNRFTGVSEQDGGIIQKISHKLKKYQTFVHTNIQDLISDNNIDFSLFERPQQDISMDFMRKNNQVKYQNLIQLDFNKIKQTLKDTNPQSIEKKCFLLDALKNRLVKTRGMVLKRQVVLSIVMNDMLCFQQGDKLIKSLLSGQNQILLVQACQFINALSKDYYGRQYLARNQFLTRTVQILKGQKTDETVRMIVLSTLQQLSVRPIGQKNMIEGDVIKWIVNKLNTQRDSMSAYVMQHTTALLVNLLLRKQGLLKSQQIKQQILQTLINLLQVQTTQIRSYVHGALYPLFSKKVFRQKAKQYGIQQNIKYLAQNTNVQLFVLQLKYLQGQLNLQQDAKEEEAQDDHDTDDIGDQQIGEDFSIQIDINTNNIMGQELLLRNYSLIGPDAISQLNQLREQVENTLKRRSVYTANSFYERPSTNNPVIAPIRRNVSNNNSVYSNKSSNRILRSQLNNRSNAGHNVGNNNTKHQIKQKLDTVQPDNSEKQMSIKDFVNQNSHQNNGKDYDNNTITKNNVAVRDNNQLPSQKGSRKRQDSDLFPGFQKQKLLQNQSFSQQVIKQNSQTIKPYENTQQYRNAFQTRARIVRTPPEN